MLLHELGTMKFSLFKSLVEQIKNHIRPVVNKPNHVVVDILSDEKPSDTQRSGELRFYFTLVVPGVKYHTQNSVLPTMNSQDS
jgi:hypothetical protein